MAETPEGLVYRGREGTGAAQVFGTEGNPMAAFFRRRQDIQRQRALQAEQDKLAKDKRDKKMWELINVSPEKAYAPFNDQVLDAAKSHRAKVAGYLERGGDPDDPQFQLSVKQGWDEINDLAHRSNYVKDVLQQTKDTIEKNPYLNYQYYFPKINDLYMDPTGKALPLDKVDVEKIRSIYTDDPGGFNDVKYTKDFMDGLNENMSSYVTQKAVNNGLLTNDVETKWKGDVYTPDPNSPLGVALDERGMPKVNVSQQMANSFLNSDTAARYYNNLAKEQGVDVNDLIRQRVSGLKVDQKPSFSREPRPWPDYSGRLKEDEVKIASRIFDHIDNISNAFFDKEGNRIDVARPAAREAVGHLKGRKLYGGTVEEVELVPGTNKPGKSTILGKPVENSANDRLVLKVSSGTRGITSVHEIDLTDEGGPSTLWNNFQDSGYMGKKNIAFDAAAEQLGINAPGLYKGREYTGQRQLAEQDKVNNWVAGKDFGDMTGHTYNGQPIVAVKPNKSWTGSFKGGYELTLGNGTVVNIKPDDYDKLTAIYRSKVPEQAEQPKKKTTGVKWD
ncbi:MAG: hypothetical protein QM762_12765 [Chryseolinea sp.]